MKLKNFNTCHHLPKLQVLFFYEFQTEFDFDTSNPWNLNGGDCFILLSAEEFFEMGSFITLLYTSLLLLIPIHTLNETWHELFVGQSHYGLKF